MNTGFLIMEFVKKKKQEKLNIKQAVRLITEWRCGCSKDPVKFHISVADVSNIFFLNIATCMN